MCSTRPGRRLPPSVPCGSTRTRSGRTIAFTSPRADVAPCLGAESSFADDEHAPVPVGSRRFGRDEVRNAEEVRDEERGRLVVDGLGRARLLDAAVVHDRDPVAHGERFLLVVRDEDERHAELVLKRLELHLEILAQPGVESCERLVEQEHARTQDQRAGQGHPLLLAAGELVRLALLEAGESHALEHLGDRRRRSSLVMRLYLSPKATLSATVRCGKSA